MVPKRKIEQPGGGGEAAAVPAAEAAVPADDVATAGEVAASAGRATKKSKGKSGTEVPYNIIVQTWRKTMH